MNSATYQRLTLRTVPEPLAYWVDGFDGDPEEARRLLMCNCALGLAGEATEIAETPTSDEIGDGYWYSYVLFHVLGVSEYEPAQIQDDDPGRAAHRAAGAVAELVKKHVFHARDFDDVSRPLVSYTRAYVDALAALDDQPAAATFRQNITKLEARYPDGFFERG